MRDYWNWWKSRKSQISGLLVLAMIIVWMSLGLWQSERHFKTMIREVRQSFRQQELTRQTQFNALRSAMDDHLSRQDAKDVLHGKDVVQLHKMIQQLIGQTGN